MKTIKLLAMALVASMALCSLPVPLTIPVIPAHTPLPAICAQEAPKAIDLGVCVKWAAKDIGQESFACCPCGEIHHNAYLLL